MDALKEVSKVWLVAKMVHTLFISILGNKVFEERLQKAPGTRHKKAKLDPHLSIRTEAPKTVYDDASFGYTNRPPVPQVSYERSRPQTPAATPSRETVQLAPMSAPPTLSPNVRPNTEPFLGTGASRSNTRPPTPFNVPYSVPATPPELYLVTRNSPTISQSLWENFQPDQLFPDSINMTFSQPYGLDSEANLDPQLQLSPMGCLPSGMSDGQQALSQRGMQAGVVTMNQDQSGWGQMQPDQDSWSNSSRGAAVVPSTLNVEDWSVFPRYDTKFFSATNVILMFVRVNFFGMNIGDMSSMNGIDDI